jgi:hypothetical protein
VYSFNRQSNYRTVNPPELKIKSQRIEYRSHQWLTIETSNFSTNSSNSVPTLFTFFDRWNICSIDKNWFHTLLQSWRRKTLTISINWFLGFHTCNFRSASFFYNCKLTLKGQSHEIFDPRFFSANNTPGSPDSRAKAVLKRYTFVFAEIFDF